MTAAWIATGEIKNLVLPPGATHVIICADHDRRRVRIVLLPERNSDFSDVLTGRVAVNEVCHVA